MATGMCRGPNIDTHTDIDIDMVLCIFLKKLWLFDRHVTHSHCPSISFNEESRIACRNGWSRSQGRHSEHKCQCRRAQDCKTPGFRTRQDPWRPSFETHCALLPEKTQSCFFFFFFAESAASRLPGGEMRGGSCGCQGVLQEAQGLRAAFQSSSCARSWPPAALLPAIFHVLEEFDEAKRSCRRRLAGHNERRRKTPSDSSVDRLDSNHHLNDNWLRHMKEPDKMTMVLERNTTAKVCKEIKNH